MLRFDDVRGRIKNGIDALERGLSFADAVRCPTEVLGGIDDGIEDDEIIDKGRGIDGSMIGEDEQSAEPEDDSDESGAEELGERVREVITAVDAIESSACGACSRAAA